MCSRLGQKLFDNNENGDEIAKEINATEKFLFFLRKKVIEIERFFTKINAEEKESKRESKSKLLRLQL